MIVFEGDYVLEECLQQVYPYAEQILIAEGPVEYWQRQGRTTSTDRTNEILDNFPDPDNKISIVHGQYSEKDEQCKAYMKHIRDDIDYLWNLDSDELYKKEDLERTIAFLAEQQATSVCVTSCSFYGGINHHLTGFELARDNFLRIIKYEPGSTWLTHRPPTIKYPSEIERKHINSDTFFAMTNVLMYHYSYVFPTQVARKVGYYKDSVSKQNCIDNYFENVYLPWVKGDESTRIEIENMFNGVHEFKPRVRGECRTGRFTGSHPESIDPEKINQRINKELGEFK